MLRIAVPVWIAQIHDKGGPDIGALDQDRLECLFERADSLLLYGSPKNHGERAIAFNRFAHAIATLAFVPGGVEFCGTRYDASVGYPYVSEENMEVLKLAARL